MRNKEVQERIRQAFDHAAPELPGTVPVVRTVREEAASPRRTRRPALGWAMAAAAAVLVFFCGFAVLHGWGTRPGAGSGLAASQVSTDTLVAATASPMPERTQPAQAPTAVAVAAPRASDPVAAETVPTAGPSSIQDGLLGEEEVRAIVLSHADVEDGAVQQWRLKLDREDGRPVYEADFIVGEAAFDYELDAYTGEILQSERELLLPPSQETSPAPSKTAPAVPAAREVDRDEALALALENAGVRADQATKVKVEADRENGRAVYEVEFVADGIEYDYEIDAATGEILQSGREKVQTTRKATAKPKATAKSGAKESGSSAKTTDTAIGKDAALSAALQNAGISANDAEKVKVDKDRENGRIVYEVEFKADGYEYEYEIDAATGAILKQDRERDDD